MEISGAGIVSKYIGDGARAISKLFSVARQSAPAILFIDQVSLCFFSEIAFFVFFFLLESLFVIFSDFSLFFGILGEFFSILFFWQSFFNIFFRLKPSRAYEEMP
jgi:hypothetical protein